MPLEKLWSWDNNAIMYNDFNEVIHEPYPFYYYMVYPDGKINYIKQISKHYSGVLDSNRYIETIKAPINEAAAETNIEDLYSEYRSWSTLGPLVNNPIEQYVEIIDGPYKTVFNYTPDGKLMHRIDYFNDKPIYEVKIDYIKSKNQYKAIYYKNSVGVQASIDNNGRYYNLVGIEKRNKKHG